MDHLERPRRRWEDSINPLNAELNPIRHLLALVGARHIVNVSRIRVKMYLQEVRWGSIPRIHLAQYRDRWRALVITAINFGVS